MSPRELDNILFASVGIQELDAYTKSENVILDGKMQFHINNIRKKMTEIEKTYIDVLEVTDKQIRRVYKKLKENIYKIAEEPGGERIELTEEDAQIITILDSIVVGYERAIENSKNIDSYLKYCMKSIIFDWREFESYIVRGARR